ncbi:serpin family protein [Candidatus Roseilinea sp. NK_OTU-006]|uniref:serpin family protein n=1 Tax=Candidatus Roseilinea sp. NK_OTU-006 TaxID=2704250 RepID=UPI00145EDA8C|nr:serpin family protein [Candidatus Roseilinea sp. NK_OTU-006]
MRSPIPRWVVAGALCLVAGCATAPPIAPTREAPTTAPSEPAPPAATQSPPTDDHTPPRMNTIRPEFTQATTTFALDLFRRVAQQDADKNVFISPANVAIALAMTANGARGETLQAMLATMGNEGATLDGLNADYAALQALLRRDDPGLVLTIANSLWARAGVPFNADFLQRARRFYAAEISELDFTQPNAPGVINGWVSDKTNGKIPDLVDDIPEDAVLFLISAIYFNGAWQTPFNAELTQDLPFNLLDGSQKQTPTMFRSGTFEYLKGGDFQAVRLPYTGDTLRMVVFLPDAGRTLAEFESMLTSENWATWRTQFAPQQGELFLPRFKATYNIALNDVLQAMGMAAAFDPSKADFSGMRPIPPTIFISSVRHLAYVEVNEAGTEAAAATSVQADTTSAGPIEDRFTMRVDRPFCFAIEDSSTGSLIFIGAIVEP